MQEEDPDSVQDPRFADPDSVRADEFETLAKMCLQENQYVHRILSVLFFLISMYVPGFAAWPTCTCL